MMQTVPPSSNEVTDNGLVAAWLLDGQGGGQRIGWPEIKAWQPHQGLLWVHLDYTHANSQRWLTDESGVDRIARRVLVSDVSRPRCEHL